MVLGLLVGTFVLSQTIYLVPDTQKDTQEQSEEKVPETVQVVTSEAVTSTSFQVNLGFQSYLLEEIFQTESNKKKTVLKDKFLSSASKALQVLLSRIIAPNAP